MGLGVTILSDIQRNIDDIAQPITWCHAHHLATIVIKVGTLPKILNLTLKTKCVETNVFENSTLRIWTADSNLWLAWVQWER